MLESNRARRVLTFTMLFLVIENFTEAVDPESRAIRLNKVKQAGKRYYRQLGDISKEWTKASKKIGDIKAKKIFEPQSKVVGHRLRKAHLIRQKHSQYTSKDQKDAARHELGGIRSLKKIGAWHTDYHNKKFGR